jgi:hypothetical protein
MEMFFNIFFHKLGKKKSQDFGNCKFGLLKLQYQGVQMLMEGTESPSNVKNCRKTIHHC